MLFLKIFVTTLLALNIILFSIALILQIKEKKVDKPTLIYEIITIVIDIIITILLWVI